MPLRHVCKWTDDHGWVSITAAEAAREHPGGTVSAEGGLFKCDICGQYVGFSDGPVRDRYFFHSSSETNKYCEDRTFASGSLAVFNAKSISLPIRLRVISSDAFELQMGFFPLATDTGGNVFRIEPAGYPSESRSYNLSRLKENGLTYLSIGNRPATKYRIVFSGTLASNVWPEWVEGITDPDTGVLFDTDTGKKLPHDADVQIRHTYYLLRRGDIGSYSDIDIERICERRDRLSTWYIYKVTADRLTKRADRFFNQFSCRLTENPVMLFPVWPVYVDSPYILRHSENTMLFYLQGHKVEAKAFPETKLRIFPCANSEDEHILSFECHGRQQLLSSGRMRVLKYTYLWRDNLDKYSDTPEITVTPLDQWGIRVEAPFDGQIVLERRGRTIDKVFLKSGIPTEVQIQRSCEVKIYQGLDLVWFERYELRNSPSDDAGFVRRLEKCDGPLRTIPHSIGAAVARMPDNPELKNWLRKKIRQGQMSESAYQMLIQHIMVKQNEKV